MDGAITKAPLGGKKVPNLTVRSKGGVLTERVGVLICVTIEGAQRHDMKLVRAPIENIIIERPEPSEERPQGIRLDKGYDYDEVYTTLQEFRFTAHVRPRGKEATPSKGKLALKHAAGLWDWLICG